MSVLTALRRRQQELLQITSEISRDHGADMENCLRRYQCLRDSMLRLGDCIKVHLGAEDREIYPQLLIHEDPRLKALAWGFISGEKPLRKQYDAFHLKWLDQDECSDCQGLLEDAMELVRMIEERVDRERHVLLPKLEHSGIFDPLASAG